MAITETKKFNNMVQAIGSDIISAIATSGAEMQVHIYIVRGRVHVCMRTCVCTYMCKSACVCILLRWKYTHYNMYFHPLQVKILQS